MAASYFSRFSFTHPGYIFAYPGNTLAITALLGGYLTSVFANYPMVLEQLNAGTLRALDRSQIQLLATLQFPT